MIVNIAKSIKYGRYKYLKNRATRYRDIILKHSDKIYICFNLPDQVHITIRPMRNLYGTATKEKDRYVIELDIKQYTKTFKNTLLHELAHIEQFYTNRLQYTSDSDFWKWNGNLVCNNISKNSHYNKLPWEHDAIVIANNLHSIIYDDDLRESNTPAA